MRNKAFYPSFGAIIMLALGRPLFAAQALLAPVAPAAAHPTVGGNLAVSQGWAEALKAYLPQSLPALSKIDPEDSSQRQRLAPLLSELKHSLGESLKSFRGMPSEDREAAIGMALEEVIHPRQQKADVLMAQAEAALRSGTSQGRQAGYMSRLSLELAQAEADPYLRPEYNSQAAKLRQELEEHLRKSRESSGAETEAFEGAEMRRLASEGISEDLLELYPASARKLLLRMRKTKSGWGEKDLDALYMGFGFVLINTSNHNVYRHPAYPHLRDTVSQQRSLPPGYIKTAIQTVEELVRLQAEQRLKEGALPKSVSPIDLNLSLGPE